MCNRELCDGREGKGFKCFLLPDWVKRLPTKKIKSRITFLNV
jgi:hypothetical protein